MLGGENPLVNIFVMNALSIGGNKMLITRRTDAKRFSYDNIITAINTLRDEQKGNNWIYAPDLLRILED